MAKGEECVSPWHRPLTFPGMRAGNYVHTCIGCGKRFVYSVDAPRPKG